MTDEIKITSQDEEEIKHNCKKYAKYREDIEDIVIEAIDNLPRADIVIGLIKEGVDMALSKDSSQIGIIAVMDCVARSMAEWMDGAEERNAFLEEKRALQKKFEQSETK